MKVQCCTPLGVPFAASLSPKPTGFLALRTLTLTVTLIAAREMGSCLQHHKWFRVERSERSNVGTVLWSFWHDFAAPASTELQALQFSEASP